MATLINTLVRAEADTNALTAQQQIFHVATLIKRLLAYLPMWEDGQKMTIPDRSGGFSADSIKFRKFNALTVTTTPLQEGVTPDGKTLSMSTKLATLEQHGDWIKLSDVLLHASIDDVLKETMDLLAENAGLKLHRILMTKLLAGTTQQIFGGDATAVGNIDATDVLSSTTIKKAVRLLETNNVRPYPDGYFRGIIHPYQQYDLMADPLWVDVAKYNGGVAAGGGPNIIEGEVGRLFKVRFRVASEMTVDALGAAGAATYSGLVYGPDSYGIIDLKSQALADINAETAKGVTINSVPAEQVDKADPLGQWGLVGWKTSFTALVLDELRIVRLRTGATQ